MVAGQPIVEPAAPHYHHHNNHHNNNNVDIYPPHPYSEYHQYHHHFTTNQNTGEICPVHAQLCTLHGDYGKNFLVPVFTIGQYWAHSTESWCPKFAHISVQLNTNMVCGTIIPVATTYLLCICRFALNTSMFLTRKLSSACNLRKDKLLYQCL